MDGIWRDTNLVEDEIMTTFDEYPKVSMAQRHSAGIWRGKAKWWLLLALCLAVVVVGAGGIETKEDFTAGVSDRIGAASTSASTGATTILVHPGELNAL